MKRKLMIAMSILSSIFAGTAGSLDADWDAVQNAERKQKPRTAVERLTKLEAKAREQKLWPDLAAAILKRTHLAYGFVEESNLQKEGPDGFVAKFAAEVADAPAEIRPMLRLALVHDYLSLSASTRFWQSTRTQIAGEAATNQPPWSAERLRPSIQELLGQVMADAPALQAEEPQKWTRLLGYGNKFGDELRPTLYDFALSDFAKIVGERQLFDSDASGQPTGLAADVLARLDERIAFHAQDANKAALAHAKQARINFLDAATLGPEKEKQAKHLADLEALAEEFFESTWVSGEIAVEAGALRRADASCDLGQLHAYYLRFADKWPKTPGGDACRRAAGNLEMADLLIDVEQNWCRPAGNLTIEYKNLKDVTFRMVALDIDDLASRADLDHEPSTHDDYLKKYFRRKAVRTWSVALPPQSDYRMHRHTVPVPDDLPKGHYALFAAPDGVFDIDDRNSTPIHVTLVTVTDLALVTMTREGVFFGYVLEADSGRPVAGAQVELWTQERRAYRRTQKTVSAADGSFRIDKPREYGYLRAVFGKDEVISRSEGSGVETTRTKQYEAINLTTDRAIYRPGQTVKFKGVAGYCNADKQDYRALPNRRVYVSFRDPNDKEVQRLALISNAYGSFSGEFLAPRDRLTGYYRLEVSMPPAGGGANMVRWSADVCVEEYKRPKFTVTYKPVADAKLGEEVRITVVATTYTGLPVPEAEVSWYVSRETCYPRWWCCSRPNDDDAPVCAEGTAKTDAKGEFTFTFTPEPPKTADLAGDPSFRFTARAVVTDGAGEAHPAETDFDVGVVPWRASVWAVQDKGWNTPTQPAKLRIHLATLNGVDVPAVKGTVKVYALKGPDKVVRKPLTERGGSWWRSGEQVVDAAADAVQLWDPTTWPNGDCVGEFPVETDAKGTAQLDAVKLPAGIYRAEYTVAAPNGKTVKDLCTWRVIEPSAATYPVKEAVYTQMESHAVPVGGTARLFWGSGYDSTYCRVIVRHGEKTLAESVLTTPAFCYELPITADMVGQLVIETVCLRENRLLCDRGYVSVERPDSDLVLTRSHFTSKLTPGAQETWSFTVSGSDTNDVRRGVEMLALLYDRSLDAFRPSNPNLSFSNLFGVRTDYRAWTAHTFILTMPKWQGYWQNRYAGGTSVLLRNWQAAPLRIIEGVSDGWRGNRYLSTRGERGRARGIMEDVSADVVSADAVGEVMMEAPAAKPLMAKMSMAPAGAARAGGEKKAVPETAAAPAEREAPEAAPRKNLAETAFFLPHLESDEKGAVTFTFTVPEALTGWKFVALAHDAALRDGVLRDDTLVTTKPLMVEPVAPRFVREGDRFLFPVKVTNTEETPQTATASLTLFDAASGQAVDLNATGEVTCALGPKETKTVAFALTIPDGCGYLRYVAKAKGSAFADGEEGYLPVLSRRIEVREALPLQIKKAGVTQKVFKELAASGSSDTLRHAGLAVQVVSDPTWYAFLALPYLMEYPHECCEQVFSRYYANALGQHIANSRPAYRSVFEAWEKADANALKSPLELNEDLKQIALDATPWVREAADETQAKRHIGELFGSARLAAEQRRAVATLEQNFKHNEDLWPWFPGGPGSGWVTLHILTGFARLDRLVADASAVEKPTVMAQARKGLDAWMVDTIDNRLKYVKKNGGEFHLSSLDLRWLYLQSFDGSSAKHKDLLLAHLRKEWTGFSIAGQALGALVLWRHGDKDLAREIVASLKERAVRSEEFGLYWKRASFFDCSLFAAPVSDQALAMEAFAEIAPEDWSAYEDARLWLLEQKRTQNWSTTVSTGDAVYAILLGDGKGTSGVRVSDDPAQEDVVTVKLGGKEVPQVGREAATGFYEYRYDAAQIAASLGTVEMARQEDKLGWVSLNWTYLEDVTKVQAFEQSGLRLTKTYFKKALVDGRTRLVALGGGDVLRPGDELVARLTIDSDRVYEYVHLKDERPASAEPVDVLSRYRWQDGLGYYQSTRDTATHYYFDRLPKGNFVLETSFRVRQQGVFTSGLASLQCMYAPAFGAHSQATTLEVKR